MKKKRNENTYDISSIKRVTKKFLEVSRCSRAKQRQRSVQTKCSARAKLLFLLIRPIVVFHHSERRCLRRLALQDLIFFGANYKYYRQLRFNPWLNLYIKFMQPLCLVQGKTSRFGMNSVSQWNETDSACELLASQVSVYTPAVSTTDTKGGVVVLSDRLRQVCTFIGSQRK